jgi:hypothetical protein
LNIFATSADPVASARALDDRRVNKMIVESCQILSSSLHLTGRGSPELYKPAYVHHPTVLWTARDPSHYAWLYRHVVALLEERDFRTEGRAHASSRLLRPLAVHVETDEEPVEFQNCTPFPDMRDVHAAYRKTLMEKWRNDVMPPTWRRRRKPAFAAPSRRRG